MLIFRIYVRITPTSLRKTQATEYVTIHRITGIIGYIVKNIGVIL